MAAPQSRVIGKPRAIAKDLQRVQIGEQILNVLLAESLAVARHLVAPQANDVGDALVICGKSAERKILMLEHALQTWPLLSLGGIWLVATLAVRVVDFAPGGLLRVKAKFGIRLAALYVTAAKDGEGKQAGQHRERECLQVR